MRIKQDWLEYLHQLRVREIEIIFRRCPPNAFAQGLELGAGDGFQSTLLTQWVSQLVCTDYNGSGLTLQNTTRIQYRVCDAEYVGSMFQPKQFDLVFSSNMLEHVPRPRVVLEGTCKVLADDGITIHVMPTPFWKLTWLVLYHADLVIQALELITENDGRSQFWGRVGKILGTSNDGPTEEPSKGNNPKTARRKRSRLLSLAVPEPHGVSSNNLAEFFAFRKSRWVKEFERAGLDVVVVLKGPVTSGHGFGLDALRALLERMGFASENVYIAIKKGSCSPFVPYFHESCPVIPHNADHQHR
ncbi:MAG TPA: class I SAM-dependent methyltransferase [Chloroflexota bacterium]|nr:class I SAM-dependent methyltransferase [Chloroflexota bacterium]